MNTPDNPVKSTTMDDWNKRLRAWETSLKENIRDIKERQAQIRDLRLKRKEAETFIAQYKSLLNLKGETNE